MESKKLGNLNKMTMIDLKDLLQRETLLLTNSKLINKLPDKGESIKKISGEVKAEIKYREELQNVQKSISNLPIGDKHVQKLCGIERCPEKERYKPFATLNHAKEVKPDSKIFKIMEDCSKSHNPTKLIHLAESIEILIHQDERVKEEQMKSRHARMLEKMQQNEETESSDSESENNQQLLESDED